MGHSRLPRELPPRRTGTHPRGNKREKEKLTSGTEAMTRPQQLPGECRMPAEWEPHEATWIAWPHNKDDWPGKFASIPWVYADIVRHLHQSERVRILVDNGTAAKQVGRILSKVKIDLKQIDFYHFSTDRVWMRDSGPIFLANDCGEIAVTDWKFNAWAKYRNWHRDDRLPKK